MNTRFDLYFWYQMCNVAWCTISFRRAFDGILWLCREFYNTVGDIACQFRHKRHPYIHPTDQNHLLDNHRSLWRWCISIRKKVHILNFISMKWICLYIEKKIVFWRIQKKEEWIDVKCSLHTKYVKQWKIESNTNFKRFIHLIAQLYSFSRINVALIMSTVQVVSFLNHFDCRMAIHCYSVIQMLCDVCILVAVLVDQVPESQWERNKF